MFIHFIFISFSDTQKPEMSRVTSRDKRLTYPCQLCPDGLVQVRAVFGAVVGAEAADRGGAEFRAAL